LARAVRERLLVRVIGVRRRKTTTFFECRQNNQYVQVVVDSTQARFHAGDFVAFQGSWLPSRTRERGTGELELLADSAELLSRPTSSAWSELERREHREPLVARARALAVAEHQLRERNFLRVETPVLMGDEAVAGPTHPFLVRQGQERAYLCVNNLVAQQRFQAAGLARVYQLSRLFWAQRFHNRFSLNEFSLLELSQAGACVDDLRELAEVLLEALRTTLVAELGTEHWPNLARPLSGLPVVPYHEALGLVLSRGAGTSGSAHVLPPTTDEVLCTKLGCPGYWLVAAPVHTAPFYARRRRNADGCELACSLELRLSGAPDAGAGSEWNIDIESAAARLAGRRDDAAVEYLSMLRSGFPSAAGFSLGIDRVLMHLLSVSNIRRMVTAPRKVKTFNDAPVSRPRTEGGEVSAPRRGQCAELSARARAASAALHALSACLEARGFLPVLTSLLQSRPHAKDEVPEVDWFGRQVQLVGLDGTSHRELVCAGPARIYEVGPCWPSAPWWAPGYVLRATWIGDQLDEVRQVGTELLALLDCSASARQLAPRSLDTGDGWMWQRAEAILAAGRTCAASPDGLHPPLCELWLHLERLGVSFGP